MKNIKTKIILSVIIFLSVVGFVGTVSAAESSLYISPASITKTAGNTFSASVGLTASGNKVCAVEGTLVFNNLTCQSITVASDVMAQSSPTCSNPHFLIGIPNCTTSDKTLLTVSVRAGTAGVASISIASVDVIGEGSSVGSASTKGNYTINAIPKAIPATPQTSNGFIGYVNGKVQTFPTLEAAQQAGATGIEPNYDRNPAEVTSASEQTQPIEAPVQETAQENNLTANVGAAALANTGASKWFNWILIIVVILIVIYAIYYFATKRKKK